MNEPTAFEHQISTVLDRMGGPEPVFDATAIARQASDRAAQGRLSRVDPRSAFVLVPAVERGISMYAALRYVAAAAVAALIGGFLLVGVVGGPEDGAPPAAAVSPSPTDEGASAQAPSSFSASFACSTYWEDGHQRNVIVGSMEEGNLVRRETRDELGRFDAEASDERLQGDWTVYSAIDEYFWPGIDPNLPLTFAPGVFVISNDTGSWQMPWGYDALPGAMNWGELDGVSHLTGSGGYEGLTAVFHIRTDNWEDCYCFESKGFTAEAERCRFEMEGYIVEGVPPTPQIPE